MSQSARKNSHVSSACVNFRRRKRKCSGSKPTCALCAEKNVQCEWTLESDGRRGSGRERDALRVENEQLKSELALLQAQLRVPGLSSAQAGPMHHAVQMQQLHLWVPDVPFVCAGRACQTSVTHQPAEPAGATPHALSVLANSWRYWYLAQDGPPLATGDTACPSLDATSLHAVNVFGPHEPPLSTSDM